VTVCRVVTYAPGRASFPPPFQSFVSTCVPKLRPYPGRDSYPRILRQCRPSTISVESSSSLRLLFESVATASCPEFSKPAAGRHPAGYVPRALITELPVSVTVSQSPSPFLAMLLLHVPSFLGRQQGDTLRALCSSYLDYSVRLWVTDLVSQFYLRLSEFTTSQRSMLLRVLR
jgi:hypothetical protein